MEFKAAGVNFGLYSGDPIGANCDDRCPKRMLLAGGNAVAGGLSGHMFLITRGDDPMHLGCRHKQVPKLF